MIPSTIHLNEKGVNAENIFDKIKHKREIITLDLILISFFGQIRESRKDNVLITINLIKFTRNTLIVICFEILHTTFYHDTVRSCVIKGSKSNETVVG